MTTSSREDPELKKAKNRAFSLLKLRPRSVHEIRQKLHERKFAASLIEDVLAYLLEYRFLDDRAFARAWIQSRLLRPYGRRRIAMELRDKGIEKELLEEELDKAFSDVDEGALAEDLARRRFQRMKGVEPLKARQRLQNYLIRRGFDIDVIRRAVQIMDEL
jgi:regulatory protein